MFKKIFIFFILFILFSQDVGASNAVIINQIRGDETCCQPGSDELIEAISSNEEIGLLPMGWAIRYDALDNQKRTDLIKKSKGELGALLEITPQLAKESGVSYRGDENGYDWHFGKNVFLIGYSEEERKKLIDTYMRKFKQIFRKNPSFSVSWMIDSWSLDYLYNEYDVLLHELTKEQYETDSYTLYGGIFNAPYFPSSHPLIPSKSGNDSIVVIRQTISDPLFNYGFPKAYYTSQPNDYLSNTHDKKNISYFNDLINTIIDQTSGFPLAVIGIENSFDFSKYGEEYLKQLAYIKSKADQKELIVEYPSQTALSFKKKFKKNPSFFTASQFSKENEFGALWYFSPHYRVRVIVKDNLVILTDLRTYQDINDPYKNYPLETDYGYFIVPYLFDGSQEFDNTSDVEKKAEELDIKGSSVLPETITHPYGIVLGEKSFSTAFSNDTFTITFDGDNKGSVEFSPESISIDKSLFPYIHLSFDISFSDLFSDDFTRKNITIGRHFDFLIEKKNKEVEMGYVNGTHDLLLFSIYDNKDTYNIKSRVFGDEVNNFSSQFQPDQSSLPVDKEKSVFYWNNTSATVNRNPIRLFILPLNSVGRPTKVQSVSVSLSDDTGISTVYPEDYSFRVSPWFIDISSSKPLATKVSVLIDNEVVIHEKNIYFLPNCKENFISCLTSGKVVIQYITDRLF